MSARLNALGIALGFGVGSCPVIASVTRRSVLRGPGFAVPDGSGMA